MHGDTNGVADIFRVNFQAWFRDAHAAGLGSNLSDGLRVELCP